MEETPRLTGKSVGETHRVLENKHSSRWVQGTETGTGVERTRVAVAGLRLAEWGTNGAGSPSTSRPCGPSFAQINRTTVGSEADCATQGSSSGK